MFYQCNYWSREGLYTDYQGAVQWSLSGTLGGPMRLSGTLGGPMVFSS